jgi:subtilase family serine protease
MVPPMRVLAVAALAFALAASPAAAAPRITFYFGLERPEAAARSAFQAVGQPGSASYRRFASVRQAARRYGASARTRRRASRALRRRGFRVRIDRSGVFARVSGPVPRFERVFRVRVRRTFNNDVNADAWFVRGRLRLPPPLRPLVREVVASFNRSTRPPRAGRAAQAPPGAPGNAGTWTAGCSAARATGAYGFGQVRTAYGLDAVGPGDGATAAIVNVGEGIPAADIRAAARCFGLPAGLRTRTLLTDGQRRPFGRGTFEPQEDLALLRGMAPALESVTFAQAWLAPELWFLGPAEVLGARRLPDVLSISYGECERQIRGRRAPLASRAGAALLDSIVVRLGLAGVATFASAGDFGSTCNGQPFAGVAWPASSRYLTAVGGTRLVLNAANERVDEVVWNDLEWLQADDGGGAGGGGTSVVGRRAVPDVSAHASMLPGWPVVLGGNWVEDAGTSASAPLVAGAFAAIGANERAAGRPPLGPVNGLLYSRQPGAFFDVVAGDNGYDRRVPAISAAPGYDRASGLGVPRFDVLATSLPPPAG